ncbi:MAG TPA: T9SS type A sorting domain-containing protein [Bacteroidales bacterium]|nr:T9SS type A sorting domain-containing protein [Bacteroidales bacterium]HOL97713.1 T9SS type A sorting domain-containing protein [Bacteroidales bacterium]HOM36334.1 T9SS type A sorting domain-containing protein [Bacteroidales bacterium]HPD23618.1 T9SS type A sorting domain-containing protein [Bacteroidales bacterium]HRS99469.1 T9SS type A sorting domain-containing protein [Bacteroidales bacterium]
MKKSLHFLFVTILLASCFTFALNAQVLYSDDFESYTVGQGIAAQETTWWNTWSGQPGGAEDPKVSDTYAYSGTKSIKVSGSVDGVIEFNDLTTGRYRVEFYIYVPTGRQAYWNIMQNFNPSGQGLIWGMQIFMKNGTITIDGAGAAAATVPFNHGEWIKVQHFIDLNSDWVDLYINDQLVHAYQWSKGTFNDGTGINKLDAFDFYAWNEGGTPEYYMDNFLIEEVETPYPPQNFSYQIQNLNDVVLTWDAPSQGSPESYSIARNGVVIANGINNLTYTDLNVYPGNYTYSLLAFYGTSSGYSAPQTLQLSIDGGTPRKYVVYEVFTSVNCSYCPYVAQALDQIAAEQYNVGIIEYHGNGLGPDQFSTPATDARDLYYRPFFDVENDGFGYPTTITNGFYGNEGTATNVQTMKNTFLYYYNELMAKPAVFDVIIDAQQISANPYKFNVSVDIEETFPYYSDEMRLFIALTETDINYSWQSQPKVNFVNRALYPNPNGLLLNFSSQSTYNHSFELEIGPSYNVDNCELVAFVQNMNTAEIMQADTKKLFSTTNLNQINSISSIYPNPASDILNIFSKEIISNIEISNICGQIVKSIDLSDNSIIVNISELEAGIYFIKINKNGNIEIQKFIKQ